MLRTNAMTIGQISRHTGVPIKALREYEHLGLLYTLGRSASNYRLFGEEALWCVQMVQSLRSLGLTLKEIHELCSRYVDRPSESMGALLDAYLAPALARVEARITELQALRHRIVAFQGVCASTTASASASTPGRFPTPSSVSSVARLLASDPRRGVR